MSDPNNPNNNSNQNQDDANNQLQEGQNQEEQETSKKEVEPAQEVTEPKPEPKDKPKSKTKQDNLKYFKDLARKEATSKKELEERLAKIEADFENERLERKKTEVINQALAEGLNPEKKSIFEKFVLDKIINEEDLETAVKNTKAELPDFFKSQNKTSYFPSSSADGGENQISFPASISEALKNHEKYEKQFKTN